MQQYIFLILMGIVFYFFMIKPQYKKQKDQKLFFSQLKKGDHVVTLSGIHGIIVGIENDFFIIEIDSNKGIKIKIEKSAISYDFSKK
jgi:preprotein translocase subunit YajC